MVIKKIWACFFLFNLLLLVAMGCTLDQIQTSTILTPYDKETSATDPEKIVPPNVKINPYKIAGKYGFKDRTELDQFITNLPRNPWSDTDMRNFQDEVLFNKVTAFHEEIKEYTLEDFDNSGIDAGFMAIKVMDFKNAAEYYFADRKKALEMYNR